MVLLHDILQPHYSRFIGEADVLQIMEELMSIHNFQSQMEEVEAEKRFYNRKRAAVKFIAVMNGRITKEQLVAALRAVGNTDLADTIDGRPTAAACPAAAVPSPAAHHSPRPPTYPPSDPPAPGAGSDTPLQQQLLAPHPFTMNCVINIDAASQQVIVQQGNNNVLMNREPAEPDSVTGAQTGEDDEGIEVVRETEISAVLESHWETADKRNGSISEGCFSLKKDAGLLSKEDRVEKKELVYSKSSISHGSPEIACSLKQTADVGSGEILGSRHHLLIQGQACTLPLRKYHAEAYPVDIEDHTHVRQEYGIEPRAANYAGPVDTEEEESTLPKSTFSLEIATDCEKRTKVFQAHESPVAGHLALGEEASGIARNRAARIEPHHDKASSEGYAFIEESESSDLLSSAAEAAAAASAAPALNPEGELDLKSTEGYYLMMRDRLKAAAAAGPKCVRDSCRVDQPGQLSANVSPYSNMESVMFDSNNFRPDQAVGCAREPKDGKEPCPSLGVLPYPACQYVACPVTEFPSLNAWAKQNEMGDVLSNAGDKSEYQEL